jgi:hypothetical protein
MVSLQVLVAELSGVDKNGFVGKITYNKIIRLITAMNLF